MIGCGGLVGSDSLSKPVPLDRLGEFRSPGMFAL